MKNIFYFSLIFILINISCEGEFFSLHFVNGVGLQSDKIFKKNYPVVGSYMNKDDTIATVYNVGEKRRLIVIKMNNAKHDISFSAVSNEGFKNISGIYGVMHSGGFKINYNTPELNKMGKLSSVKFSSDGLIKFRSIEENVNEAYIKSCNTFTIEFNNSKNLRIYGEAKQSALSADCMFYEKGNVLYICVLTSSENQISEHLIYDYMF